MQVRDNQIEYYTAPEVQVADNKSQTQYLTECCLGLINLCLLSGVAILHHGQRSPLAASQIGFHVTGAGTGNNAVKSAIESLPSEKKLNPSLPLI